MKDSDAGHNTVDEIFQGVNAVLSSTKLREKASDVVLEMLSPLEVDTPAPALSPHSQAFSYIGALPMSVKPKLAPSITRGVGSDTSRMPLMIGSRAMPSATGSRAMPLAMSTRGSGIPDSSNPQIRDVDMAGFPSSRIGGSAGASPGGALTSATGIRSMMPSLTKVLATRGGAVVAADGTPKKGGVDVALLLCLALWYLGNYYYNISNKMALTAAGGAAGFPMTIATMQLGIGVLYALFLWLAPDGRKRPTITFDDYVKTLPLGAATAAAHAATVFSLSAGSVSFAQIVKSAEPAFAAVIATYFYSAKISRAKWLTLIPVIGGVCLASLGELNFAMAALVTASLANIFAALRGNENLKLMKAEGIADRIGTVGNQFALSTINAFFFILPLMLLTEGSKLGEFMTLLKSTPSLVNNLIASGLWFYLYNELATKVIQKTNAVTQSVANTAKRVIVIIVVALVMKEGLSPLKLIGSGVAISGVFLYSIIDKLVAARKDKKATLETKTHSEDGPVPTRRLMEPTFV